LIIKSSIEVLNHGLIGFLFCIFPECLLFLIGSYVCKTGRIADNLPTD